MGDSRLTRRALLRSAAVAAGGVGIVTAIPGVAAADGTPGPSPVPTSTTVGADAPGELGASLAQQPLITAPPVDLTVPAAPAPKVAVTAALPYRNFLRYDFELRDTPPQLQPYALATPPPVPYGVVDATGVRMVKLGTTLWNHPVAQAQYGMAMLEGYRLTGDHRYWRTAVLQATRILGRARAYGGALFHPYDFAVQPHRTAVRTPPWYSAMAQGQVLDFFTRMHKLTGDLGYKAEADGTFRAFLVPQVAGKPWVAWVYKGLLWLDEYPRTDIALGDRTYNGSMFSAFGLYQYFLLTGDERAKQLVQGMFSTARAVAQQVRTPGWRSVYCLQDRADSSHYHVTHSAQHLLIAILTGDPSFQASADNFQADYPQPAVGGTVVFAPGFHAGYAFNANGGVTASRSITVKAGSMTSAPCDTRTRIINRPDQLWYRISVGSLAGYYVPEVPGFSYLRASVLPVQYLPYRTGALTQDVATAVQPPPTPTAPLPTRSVDLPKGTTVTVDQRLTVNAVPYLRMVGGADSGWWVPAAAVSF